MAKRKKQIKQEQTFFAASASECTGLIPAGTKAEAELEAYNEIFPIYPDADSVGKP